MSTVYTINRESHSAPRPTFPLPNELIDQIISRLCLYDRRSFALCSRANYEIAYGELFDDVVLGRTAGTIAVANGILRGGKGRGEMRRNLGRMKLSVGSMIMMKGRGTFGGDVRFLMQSRRVSGLVRNLHIGLPETSAWRLRDPSDLSSSPVDLEKLELCLSNLPNLRSISLYAPTPYEGNYEGLDVRLFDHVLSQFNDCYRVKELNITWWPQLSKIISDPMMPFYLPDGSQLLPTGMRDKQADGTMDVGLHGPPAAEAIRLNMLPGDFPSNYSGEYTYTPRRTWRDAHAGSTAAEQKTLQLLIPRMLYSLLLPSCLSRTLTTLELEVDTCPCCCLSKTDQTAYTSIAEWEPPDLTFPLPPPLLPMGFYHNTLENIRRNAERGSEFAFNRFNLKDFKGAPLKRFSYRGPKCPKGSWMHYASDTWGRTLESLSVIESKIPHGGAERGEKYGRGQERWDSVAHALVLMRMEKLRHLRIAYSFPADERDTAWVAHTYQCFDDEGNRNDGEDGGISGTPFEIVPGSVPPSPVIPAVVNAIRQLTAQAEEQGDGPLADEASPSSTSPPPPSNHPTPLCAAVTAFYRSGRKRRIREIKKLIPGIPTLERISWSMQGFFLPFDEDSSADDVEGDDPARDINEIALAETVCFDLLVNNGKLKAGPTEGLGGVVIDL